jgi:hypothetical protein
MLDRPGLRNVEAAQLCMAWASTHVASTAKPQIKLTRCKVLVDAMPARGTVDDVLES